VVVLGTAFYRVGHPFFVISDPAANNGKVLCVNLTTLDEDCPDDECILDENDYAWIKPNHPTAVAFSRARVWDAVKLDHCLQSGELHPANPPIVPAVTVAKVVAAAKIARELSADKKAFL
jgi:hypothetical protein